MPTSTKAENIHRKRAWGGLTTASEVWRKTVLRGHLCTHCSTAPAIGTINMFWPAEDIERDQPQIAAKMFLLHHGSIPYVEFDSGCGEPRRYVPMPVMFFCPFCRVEMERWAARAPSKVVAEIRTGPDPGKTVW